MELEDLSNYINLSPERIRHLFVEQMHIPFTQYVLWKRIRKTIQLVIREESTINEACHRFGFTDQPHFNRSFKRIFGLTPLVVIRNCRVLL
ncbi:helix-turn-helix transcriptional regulator [Dyadobacter sp. NIV53]|uniref:helix-turn-helix transcriptional regulator n=1 Tax=Dyadobacter sp. NIV53 TaxID=2861765 RepID=UPI001C8859D4|nr:helix-turn-helix transcriptional regulator [Dyadobacter sp. NIV53]